MENERTPVEDMSVKEMTTEILLILRTTQDALEKFMETASSNPMLKMFGIKGK